MKKNKIILIILILSIITLIFSGCGGSGGGNPIVPPIDETTTEEEYNTVIDIGDLTFEEYLNFKDTYGEEVALQKTVDYLNQQEEIKNVYLDEGGGAISFEFKNGQLGVIITYDVTKSPKLEADNGESLLPIKGIKYLLKGTPTEKKAFLLRPFPSMFDLNSAQYIKGKLETIGYQCDYYEKEEVTVDLMKNMEDYGIIYIQTHGGIADTNYGKQVGFTTGQKVTEQLYKQHYNDLDQNRLAIVWIYSSYLSSLVDKKSPYFGIFPSFIYKYSTHSYPNSLIFIDACDSYRNSTLAEAFVEAGAYVYCGYSTPVFFFNNSEQKVFNNMIDEAMTIQKAVDEVGASNLYFYPDKGGDFYLVGEVDSNHPPVISSLTANPSSININETTTITCTASDEDVGDTLIYTWNKNGGTFEGSTSGSSVTWRAPSTEGNYTVGCEVSDGEASDSKSVNISVGDVNHPPVITSTAVTSATKDEPYSYDVNATDSDGDTLTYSLTTSPPGMTINFATGLISWTPTATGSFGVTVKVSDGELFDTQSFTVTVEENSTYSLRDIGPAGGYIFYDKGYYSSGWRYLEAAPASTEWEWKEWGSCGTFIGGTGTGIGTGQSNTTTIATWLNNHDETNRAAQLCDALVYGGYDDWFLPSKDELNKMWINLKSGTDENNVTYTPVGFFNDYIFWSSSEYNAYSAWSQGFSNGGRDSYNEGSTALVRAVRAF